MNIELILALFNPLIEDMLGNYHRIYNSQWFKSFNGAKQFKPAIRKNATCTYF